MRRYFGASLLIGSLVSLLVLVLYEIDVFPWLAAGIGRAYAAVLRTTVEIPPRYWRLCQYGVVILAALGVAWTSVDIERWSRRALIAGMAIASVGLLSLALALKGILFEPVSGMLAALGSFVAGGFFASSDMGKGQRTLRELMARRLAERDLAQLMASPTRLPLEGEHREVTVMVCRILNDGDWRTNLGPSDVVRAVNLSLRTMSALLMQKGAFIEHACPDMIRVLFGAPVADPEHARRACESALDLSARLVELNRECENRWQRRFVFGIGVVSGTLTLAQFRDGGRSQYGALGWEMDFARQLSGANAHYGTRVLIGAATNESIAEKFATRPLEPIIDAESGTSHGSFELIGPVGEETEEAKVARTAFAEGMAHLLGGRYGEAAETFASARGGDGSADPTLEYYIGHARELAEVDRQASGR